MSKIARMYKSISKNGRLIADSLMTTKQTILLMLFANYIWDLVRRDYIDSRKRDYESYYGLSNDKSYSDGDQPLVKDLNKQKSRHVRAMRTLHDKTIKNELDDLLNRDFEYQIPAMPKFLKMYRIFSTTYVICAFIKYTILCMIQYDWIGIDRTYSCYLPGRLYLLPDEGFVYELPWVAFAILLCHLYWRIMWHFSGPINIDCLLFLYHDKDTVLDKQYQVLELNDPNMTPPDVAYRKYLCNRIFYQRRIDPHGHAVYIMRQHRTIEHYEQMQNLLTWIRIYNINVLCFCCVIMTPLTIYATLSHDFFDMNYPSCRSFSSSADNIYFQWSFSRDRFRLCYLFVDLFDCLIFFGDTALGLVVPISSALIVTEDLCLRFDALRERTSNLNEKFRSSSSAFINLTIRLRSSTITHQTAKCLETLQGESDSIFDETVDAFEQIRCVDDLISALSSFTLFAWFLFHTSYQASSILNKLPKGKAVTYANLIAMAYVYSGILLSFMMFARPFHKAQKLYKEFCVAMALCPNIPETKIAWRWLLEYYGDKTKYSLHLIGKSYTMSNLNILRCASWLVTCTVILLSLLRH